MVKNNLYNILHFIKLIQTKLVNMLKVFIIMIVD